VNVLIIEKNEHLRGTLSNVLASHLPEDNILLVGSGQAALHLVEQFEPALILVGYKTDDIKPFELFEQIKSTIGKFLYIILYSAESKEYKEELLTKIQRGSDSHRVKAVEIDALADELHHFFVKK